MSFFSGTREKTHTFSSSTSVGVLVPVLTPQIFSRVPEKNLWCQHRYLCPERYRPSGKGSPVRQGIARRAGECSYETNDSTTRVHARARL